MARPASSQALSYYNVTPCRAADTRFGYGGAIGPGVTRNFSIKGVCGVPGDAKGAIFTATGLSPSNGGGFITFFPAGTTAPGTSNLNVNNGDAAVANAVVVQLGSTTPDLSVAVCCMTTHLIIDIAGYLK